MTTATKLHLELAAELDAVGELEQADDSAETAGTSAADVVSLAAVPDDTEPEIGSEYFIG